MYQLGVICLDKTKNKEAKILVVFCLDNQKNEKNKNTAWFLPGQINDKKKAFCYLSGQVRNEQIQKKENKRKKRICFVQFA